MHLAPSSSRERRPRAAGTALLALRLLAVTLLGSWSTAHANDLSDYPCTAGDVEIVGSGIVVNEPCTCPPGGTFTATVQFTVRNNTSTGRYCIALHLVPDGSVVTGSLDLILRDANGNSTAPGKSGQEKYHDTVMYGSIPNFPCNTGLGCFGDAGVVRGKCTPGTCTTISWNTSPGASNCTTADQSPPGGQCRHQQVCVIGFGASLNCTTNCTVSCAGSATLRACVTGPPSRGPFTLTLTGDDGSTQSQSSFGDPSGTSCLNFTVSPGKAPTTTYTLTVMDMDGCTRTASTSLDVRLPPTSNAGNDQAKCAAGATTPFTLNGTATNGTATWSVVSGPATIANASSLTSGVTFTGTGTATLRLTVTNPPCAPKTDDVILTVNGVPTANAGTDQSKCSGSGPTTSFTLNGSATNGSAVWSVVSGPVVIANANDLQSGVTFTGGGTAKLRLTVTSNANPQCTTATDDVNLEVTVTNVTITPSANTACNGVLSFTASVAGGSGCGFVWTIDDKTLAEFTAAGSADDARVARAGGTGSATLEIRALDNVCHTIKATASCSSSSGTCVGSSTTTTKQCVGASQSCSQ